MIHRVCFHLNFFNPTKHTEYIYTWINVYKWSRKSHINLRLCLLILYSANIMPGTVLTILHILTCYNTHNNHMGLLPFWWQRGTLKHREVKPPAQPHTAETTERGLNPRLSGSGIHAYSPPPSVSCPDEVVLGWDEVKDGDWKEVQYKTLRTTWTPQISLCIGAGPSIMLNSYCWVMFGWFLIFLI